MAKAVYLIPDGPKNLAPIFPAIVWENVKEYYLEVLDINNNVVATTPILKPCSCCNQDEGVRMYFLNAAGGFDGVNFLLPRVVHETTAGEFQRPLTYPLQKTDTGIERINVRSNDTYEVKRKCLKEEMTWLQECADSPKAFVDWSGIEGQGDNYLPIVIAAGKFEKLKNDREWDYEFSLQFKLSNEFGTQRS